MERNEFLSLLGTGAAAFFAVGCFGGCGSKEADPQPGSVPGGSTGTKQDFTIDLNEASYTLLKTKGNALIKNGVIVAYTNAGLYIAVASVCTHQGGTIGYNASGGKFVCPSHGSGFNENGSVANGPATQALQQFKTSLSGTNLRVFES